MVSVIRKARKLRRDQTDAERVLWFRLRDRRVNGLKFRRQVPIGGYIVDFCCEASKLILEIDGGQHAIRGEQDASRAADLESRGYLVLRFWNNDVLRNTDGVVETIIATLKPVPPHPNPLQPKSDVSDFGRYSCRTRVNPSSGGERERA